MGWLGGAQGWGRRGRPKGKEAQEEECLFDCCRAKVAHSSGM